MKKGAKPIIAFEGIDGSGKTTQIKLAKNYLQSKGIKVTSYREPGGTEIGEQIRAIILNSKKSGSIDAALFAAARAALIEEHVKPDIDSGKVVLLDRSYYSSLVYQSLHISAPDPIERVFDINRYILGDNFAYTPYFILYFDIDPSIAFERLKKERQLTKFETLEGLKKVANRYEEEIGLWAWRICTDRPIEEAATEVRNTLDAILSELSLLHEDGKHIA